MDYRTNVRAIRALADGPEAFWAAVHDTPGFDGRSFGEFATRSMLSSWIGPLLEDDRLHELVPADLLEVLVTREASARRRNVALMDVTKRLSTALDDAGIESLFLKGLIFAERYYGDVHRRHQMDVDVLVRPAALDAALAALGASGFDTSIDQASGKPMQERLQRIRRPGRHRVPHAVAVGGAEVGVDLHWCLRSRALTPRQEERIWASRTPTSLAGTPLHTLSDEYTLMFLLLSIGSDVKRGALSVKQFLDLYLLLRAREHEIDWKAFFARRAEEGLLRICVNVLAILVVVWNVREQFPELGQALEERRRLVELRDEAEAVALLERPKGNAENHLWRRRILPTSRWAGLALRLTIDLPHTLVRLGPSGYFRGQLAAEPYTPRNPR
jgi:hypothetical protein